MAIIRRPNKNGVSFQIKLRDQWEDWFESLTFSYPDDYESEELALAAATRAHAELVTLKKRGMRASGDPMLDECPTVTVKDPLRAYSEAWKKECRTDVSEGWKKSQDQMIRDHILGIKLDDKKSLGEITLGEFHPRHVSLVLSKMKAAGLSDQMRLHVYNILHKMFGDAKEHFRVLYENPVLERYRPKVAKVKRSFLTPAQSWQLLDFTDKLPDHDRYMRRPIWLMLLAGLRGEVVIPLQWNDIRWQLDQIIIRKAYKRKMKRTDPFPKGKDWEVVHLTKDLKDDLWAEWLQVQNPEAYVCPGPKGGQLSYHTFYKSLKRICKLAGVPDLQPHELRHSNAELMVESGASETDVQRAFHHKSSKTTQGYMHRTEERLKRVYSNMNRPTLHVIHGNKNDVPTTETGVLAEVSQG